MSNAHLDRDDAGKVQAAAPPEGGPAPPRDWLGQLRDNLDQHVLFWIMALVALYVFFFVPQVANVWKQQPPWQGGWLTVVGYFVFLTFLVGFYGLSLFVVIRRFPSERVQRWVEALIRPPMEHWQKQGKRRFRDPFYWLSVFTWRAPDLCSRWLVAAVSNPKHRPGAPRVALGLLALAAVGATALVFGTRSDASRAYPLAGAFCQNMAPLCLAAAAWLMVAVPRRLAGADRPGEVGLYFGRFIAWLISTALIGEVLWWLASTNWLDNLFSYRLYTIWAGCQLLAILVITGLLLDRWHEDENLKKANKGWPVRQAAVLLIPLVVIWLFTRSLPVDPADLDRDLTDEQIQAWKTMHQGQDGPDTAAWHARSKGQWLTHLNTRVREVPKEQPVILVAASGGGSRAAIFTALVLEALARTPTARGARLANEADAPRQRTWADNIVLISSVSGGSLATAQHVAGRKAEDPPELVPGSPGGRRVLLNTGPVELRHWGERDTRVLISRFLERPPDGTPEDVLPVLCEVLDQTSRQDPEAAVQTVEEAEGGLRDWISERVRQREQKQKALASTGGPQARDEQLAGEIDSLTETTTALRTALSLLSGYRSLIDPPNAPLGRWIWTSRPFDEMGVDFMAPLMRGGMTPAMDRGDALLRFWTHRFGWYDCTNFSGYHGPVTGWGYGKDRPAVVFNAVDVARGSRLMVGFPPVPSDFWDPIYRRSLTREVPRALNAPVSLARAVRMSSNFPYGFRAMEFRIPGPAGTDPERVHVLDGGVVDNTGLDTVYELLQAVEYHADPKNHSGYQAEAAELLANLRRHGACVLEIDAGAKPNTDLPAWFNPFGGVSEQSQALENGGYSNADRTKQFYLKEIRRILSQRLEDESGKPFTGGKTSLRDLEEGLPATALHYCFQCNHYQPGHGADPAIMTAWALGPRDKAEVVARFLLELGMWEQRREQLWADLNEGKAGVARARQLAALRILLDRVDSLARDFRRLFDDLAGPVQLVREDKPVAAGTVSELRGRYSKAMEQLTSLGDDVRRQTDGELRVAWEEVNRLARQDGELLTQVVTARTAAQRAKAQAYLKGQPDLAQQSKQSMARIDASLQAVEADLARKGAAGLTRGKLLDPQRKYDQANRQVKEVYGRPPATKR